MYQLVVLILLVLLATPLPTAAQSFNSRWGLQASFVPSWSVPEPAKDLFDAEVLTVEGSEIRVGVVRGRTLGGDWGISYVQKGLKDGSFADSPDFTRTTTGVTVRGIALDKFAPFGTIKERVQIGMIFGIGAGQASGTVQQLNKHNGLTEEIEAKQFFSPMGQEIPVVPLARLELAVAAIVMPGFKIRASGGVNYPGVAKFTLGAVYLFGER